jgi:hypothetical protein
MNNFPSQIKSNLPAQTDSIDSADFAKVYFNNYANPGEEYKSGDVDAAVAFLEQKGFGQQASIVTAIILLKQAKIENISVNALLDTLKGLESLELSSIVSTILNQNRSATSKLGYRVTQSVNQFQVRNVVA